jgi:hypothetical protein
MALIAKSNSNSAFKPVPQGMHLARCYRIVDLGTQRSDYLGQIKHLPKVMIQFEVHGNDDEGNPIVTSKNEPMSISKNFTLSLGEKSTLRKDLQTWRGREFTQAELNGFELKNVLGAWAMISVIKGVGKDGNEYTNIATINTVPSALKSNLPQGFNKTALFEIDNPNNEMWDSFSDGLKQKISLSPEWQARSGNETKENAPAKSNFSDMEDDIPF